MRWFMSSAGTASRLLGAEAPAERRDAVAPAERRDEVDIALFRSSTLIEAAFALRGPRALLLSDAAFKMDDTTGAPGFDRGNARALGVWGRLGCPFRVVFMVYRKARPALGQGLAT